MYDTLITDISFEETKKHIKSTFAELKDSGSYFCFCKTKYDKRGNVLNDVFDFIKLGTDYGFEYINTIILPCEEVQNSIFKDNISYIIWFCKDKAKLYFDKDSIREKHIWKDVEWGKREKNYNKKGKDPGNVWIPTLDDGKGKITKHILMSFSDAVLRILKSTYQKNAKLIFSSECNINKILSDYNCEIVVIKEKINVSDVKIQAFKDSEKTILEPAKVYFSTSENMKEVKDSSVKTIVTSPPYWNLKDYFKKGQIGQEPYERYLKRINKVWQECYQKLKDDGSLWININVRVKEGNLILLPYDFIYECKKIGFFYKGIFIWHKSSGIPTHAKNIVDHFEFVLLFTKEEKFSLNIKCLNSFCDYKNKKINGGNIWNINRKAGSVGTKTIHPAIYPKELVERIIKSSSSKGDFIMDPFLGSGTSLISAVNSDRNFIGYEYNEGFQKLMETRFKKEINKERSYEFI